MPERQIGVSRASVGRLTTSVLQRSMRPSVLEELDPHGRQIDSVCGHHVLQSPERKGGLRRLRDSNTSVTATRSGSSSTAQDLRGPDADRALQRIVVAGSPRFEIGNSEENESGRHV